ncbi:NmrA-like family domain-containing protein 1 [Holothuria leucospilota]|uniref:NmrA-like family domain-containing protein 1 n=1 Tax=Holothuria leucospilota TaxID=206669 RepID=A0A9Q1BR27_HOLLE|nr:NmrA-like family domain-containing protein 1 [Holothuria leucospilota]
MGQCCSSGGDDDKSGASRGADEAGTPVAPSGETAQQIEETPGAENEKPKESEQSGGAKPVVFVLGASGSIGTATVQSLCSKFVDKVEIRAGVRNPDKADKLKEISGVTIVEANMADKDGLVTTLKGVSALFIVVPGAENRVELAALTVDAAKEAGVKHIVSVSGPTVVLADTITAGAQFKEIESKVSGIGIPFTFVRLTYFMDNYLGYASTVKENGQFYAPFSGDKPFTVMAASDAGLAAATILVDPSKHEGKTYDIVSCGNTMDDIASTLSTLLEKEVTFVKTEVNETRQTFLGMGVAEWQVDTLLDFFRLIEEGSPVANLENLEDFKNITGEDPTSLKDFLTNVVEAFK